MWNKRGWEGGGKKQKEPKRPRVVILFDLFLPGGVTDEVGEIRVHRSFPCTSRIVLEPILVILTWCKKYSSKNLWKKIWLPSYRAKKELNNLFTFQDESLLYVDLAQMIVTGDTTGWSFLYCPVPPPLPEMLIWMTLYLSGTSNTWYWTELSEFTGCSTLNSNDTATNWVTPSIGIRRITRGDSPWSNECCL